MMSRNQGIAGRGLGPGGALSAVIWVAMLALATAGCGATPAPPPPGVVTFEGGGTITLSEEWTPAGGIDRPAAWSRLFLQEDPDRGLGISEWTDKACAYDPAVAEQNAFAAFEQGGTHTLDQATAERGLHGGTMLTTFSIDAKGLRTVSFGGCAGSSMWTMDLMGEDRYEVLHAELVEIAASSGFSEWISSQT